jgi:lysophospholipase L1-like esterase
MEWKAKLSLFSIVMIPVTVCAIVAVLFFKPFHSGLPVESDSFLLEATQLGTEGHLLIPNLDKARIVTADRPHDPEEVRSPEHMSRISRRRVFYLSTSSQGFRGPEVTEKTGFRILCIGESVTFGWGVTAEESYPAKLAKLLGVEVINAGVPAMRPYNMAAWLQQNAKKYNPDLVLLTGRPDWGRPEPWRAFFSSLRAAKKAAHPAPLGLVLPPISNFDIRGKGKLEEERRQLQAGLSDVPWLDLTPAFRKALPAEGVSLKIEDGMHRMIDLSTGNILAEGIAPADRPGMPAMAGEIIVALEEDHSLREPLIFDGAHPDAEGNQLFAEEVAGWISRNRWIR